MAIKSTFIHFQHLKFYRKIDVIFRELLEENRPTNHNRRTRMDVWDTYKAAKGIKALYGLFKQIK